MPVAPRLSAQADNRLKCRSVALRDRGPGSSAPPGNAAGPSTAGAGGMRHGWAIIAAGPGGGQYGGEERAPCGRTDAVLRDTFRPRPDPLHRAESVKRPKPSGQGLRQEPSAAQPPHDPMKQPPPGGAQPRRDPSAARTGGGLLRRERRKDPQRLRARPVKGMRRRPVSDRHSDTITHQGIPYQYDKKEPVPHGRRNMSISGGGGAGAFCCEIRGSVVPSPLSPGEATQQFLSEADRTERHAPERAGPAPGGPGGGKTCRAGCLAPAPARRSVARVGPTALGLPGNLGGLAPSPPFRTGRAKIPEAAYNFKALVPLLFPTTAG
ncbi:hypothetical protein SAMN05421763_103599 [[Luteovulum] sphaeroides subsp. megalophilum]|nr:hypothetical protein SAMN05421763_103599 [[Luteovulum] sphaeroides subsp. megalophilum]